MQTERQQAEIQQAGALQDALETMQELQKEMFWTEQLQVLQFEGKSRNLQMAPLHIYASASFCFFQKAPVHRRKLLSGKLSVLPPGHPVFPFPLS